MIQTGDINKLQVKESVMKKYKFTIVSAVCLTFLQGATVGEGATVGVTHGLT